MIGNTSIVSEMVLWSRFKAGEQSALNTLMTSYFRILFNYGTKFSVNKEFVKDCIQDLFLYLWENKSSLSLEVNVKAYLMASLRRRIHRNIVKQVSNSVLDEFNEGSLSFALELSVEDTLIQDENTRVLAQEIKLQLESLPKRQREVVYLKFFEGLSREQIVEVMGINDQSVSNLLQLAIKHIKSNWNKAAIAFLLLHLPFKS